MTDTPSKDAPDEITLCASLHATATSRPSSPKQSPAAPMITRARKLKAAANRLQKHSSTSTPTSRPHVRRIGKLLPPRRRQAPTIKAATTKSAKLTAAAEEAAAAISLVPQPSQLHLVPTLQEGSKAELQDYQESVASTPADSEEQASTDSSSPTSSSSWEHNTPPSSSPSLSPSPKGLALFRTGICADGPGRQRATQQASFAAPPKRARAHSAPPATTFCPCLLAVQACRAGRQEDLFGEGCARSAVSPLFPGEGTRMTSTGRATEATLESLAQAGASQTATGNPTLLEPSPPSSGHATRPTRPPERAASPVSDGVVCLPPTSSPQQQHSPPLSRSKESTGASSATAAAPPNSAASTAPHPPSAFGPMRPLTVDASTEADYEEARRKHQQKNGFPCQASTATNAPSSRQPASAAPPSKGKGPRQKPGRRQHQLDIIEHLVANEPRRTSATILYRPKGRKNNFLSLSRDAIAAQLSKVPGTKRVRINFSGNVVAVDTTPGADTSALLAVESIGNVAVNAKTANKGTCTGVLHGVDAAFDEEVLKNNIESSAPILSCARTGRNVLLRFVGNAPPPEVALFKQTRPVRCRRRRPLQCAGCGAFGHTHATCTSSPRCSRCGGDHARADCVAPGPKCLHCGGPHPATEPRCPRWQHERKVLEIMASADPPLSRREAERNLKSEGKAVPARAPCTGISSVVQPGRTYSAVVSPPAAEPSAPDCEVQKDMVISALAAAVQALIGTIPQSGPVFELCNAALAAHAALNQHG